MKKIINNHFKTLFTIGIFFLGCSQPTTEYTGRTLKLEFAGVNSIEDGHWIEIDGIRYTHYQDYDLQSQDTYSLPASKSRYEMNGVERFEPNNAFTIGLLLNLKIQANSENDGLTKAVIVPKEAYQLHIAGTLIVQRPDSSSFSIVAPKEYPVKISVIQ